VTDDDSGKSAKGEVKEVLGAVTGDRHMEAEGRVEQRVADPDAPEGEENEAAVAREERLVRQDHNDVPGGSSNSDGPLGT
jgi:uncharacterized protein YjbJ (UPF0337 family)